MLISAALLISTLGLGPSAAPGMPAPTAGLIAFGPDADEYAADGVDDPFDPVVDPSRMDAADQVRIEQHLQIRIIARPGPIPMETMLDDSGRGRSPRMIEVKIGKCIASNNFVGVTPGAGRRLFLYTRDNRIFSALLERACEARDFYLGFYLARSADAKLCVDRDRLLSRAGANCLLKQIRELIEVGD